MPTTSCFDGFETYVIENERLRLTLLPSLGGKAISLINKQTGREWLDRPSGRPFQRPTNGSFWGDWDRCGWDEMIPTIDPCTVTLHDGSVLYAPDHGEVWSLPWSIYREDYQTTVLSVEGPIWPYSLEKRISLNGSTIQFSYRLLNKSKLALPFIWAPHPILKAREGMQIILPDSVDNVVVAVASTGWLGERDSSWNWPVAEVQGKLNSLDSMPALSTNRFQKLYVNPDLHCSWCMVLDPSTGEAFRFDYDPSQLPYTGIWMNAGGWAGEYQVALEPSTGYLDHLGEAFATGRCASIEAGEGRSWELACSIT
ncbi:hypothetical protein [Cohnella abietis]|uniref:Galactose mutarotase n=1 Tax=Cohnella abietis TaxID=2507935 RepID=A0A3T1DBF7_9BACL|nr:hypothetical protein [Cohnella abietis]BBI35466.1 hypothetical protein KCTCHS21_48650 [Cohnella abietis]